MSERRHIVSVGIDVISPRTSRSIIIAIQENTDVNLLEVA